MYPLFHLPRKKHSVYLNQYPKIHMEVGKKQNFICENFNLSPRKIRRIVRCVVLEVILRAVSAIYVRFFDDRSKTEEGKVAHTWRRNNATRAKPIFRHCGTAFIREFNGSIRTVGSPQQLLINENAKVAALSKATAGLRANNYLLPTESFRWFYFTPRAVYGGQDSIGPAHTSNDMRSETS